MWGLFAMQTRFIRNAVILGLLSAIGPFAIDMYLPALPSIGQSLGADITSVQLSLMLFFVSFGAFQLVFGPLSDMFGRRLPLYVGLVLFALGGIGCALAPDITTLNIFRFIQGIGACAGMVISRAVVRDLHTGIDAARMMSLLMLVFSVSPILAPLTGSIVIELFDWRAVFWVVTVAALLGIILIATMLPETRPKALRVESGVGSALSAYRLLFGDGNFLALSFIGGFGIASFFVYLANSPFVLIDHYGLTPTLYSVFFSINAVSFFTVSQFTGKLADRFGLKRVVKVAVVGYFAAIATLFVLSGLGVDRLDVLAVFMFIACGFLGLVIPTTAVLALEEHGEIAGTASALMGTLHFTAGAVAVAVVGLYANGTAFPMIAGIAACALITFVLTQLALRQRRAVEIPAE